MAPQSDICVRTHHHFCVIAFPDILRASYGVVSCVVSALKVKHAKCLSISLRWCVARAAAAMAEALDIRLLVALGNSAGVAPDRLPDLPPQTQRGSSSTDTQFTCEQIAQRSELETLVALATPSHSPGMSFVEMGLRAAIAKSQREKPGCSKR